MSEPCYHCGFEPVSIDSLVGPLIPCPACKWLRPAHKVEAGWNQEVDAFGHHSSSAAETEREIQDFLFGFVRALRPALVVETGCFKGVSTRALGQAVEANGTGRVVTCDIFLDHVTATQRATANLPVEVWACRGIELPELKRADFVFCDSDYRARHDEVMATKPGAIIVLHDTRISYDSAIEPHGRWVEEMGGMTFGTHRGFGILRRR